MSSPDPATSRVFDRLLAAGVTLERIEEHVAAGRVRVDGELVTDPYRPARPTCTHSAVGGMTSPGQSPWQLGTPHCGASVPAGAGGAHRQCEGEVTHAGLILRERPIAACRSFSCASQKGKLIAARELLDRNYAVLDDWRAREADALAGRGWRRPEALAVGGRGARVGGAGGTAQRPAQTTEASPRTAELVVEW
jgi:hypothetical protein